jgi:hypothetical protein
MAFNDVFIIFAILLVLLILISTLGGAVRFHERFEENAPTVPVVLTPQTNELPSDEAPPKEDTVEAFDGEVYAGFEEEGADKAEEEHATAA